MLKRDSRSKVVFRYLDHVFRTGGGCRSFTISNCIELVVTCRQNQAQVRVLTIRIHRSRRQRRVRKDCPLCLNAKREKEDREKKQEGEFKLVHSNGFKMKLDCD